MKKYGNFLFTRRMVISLLLCLCSLVVIMPCQSVHAVSLDSQALWEVTYLDDNGHGVTGFKKWGDYCNFSSSEPVYSVIVERPTPPGATDKYVHDLQMLFFSKSDFTGCTLKDGTAFKHTGYIDGCYYYLDWHTSCNQYARFSGSKSDIFYLCDYPHEIYDVYRDIANYILTGKKTHNMIIGGSDTHPTAVTNESIGYLQNVKLNLSYITPIKGDSIFETTNYQIYTDMFYNLKWNSKKTSTNYDLSSSYVQLYAKAEYRKSEFDDITATDFIELGDYEKASKVNLSFHIWNFLINRIIVSLHIYLLFLYRLLIIRMVICQPAP